MFLAFGIMLYLQFSVGNIAKPLYFLIDFNLVCIFTMVCPKCNAKTSKKNGVPFPSGGKNFNIWVESLKIELTEAERRHYGRQHFYVCFDHFAPAERIIENNKIVGVRPHAIPMDLPGSRLKYTGSTFPEYVIVHRSCLEDLLKYCKNCGLPINHTLDYTLSGTNITYHYHCAGCKTKTDPTGREIYWSAQPTFEPAKGRSQTTGNLSVVAASILSPISYNVCSTS